MSRNNKFLNFKLRLGAQSVTLLSTLRDPTQLRSHQCACACYAIFEWTKNSNSYCSSEAGNRPDKKVQLAAKKSSARD